MAHTVSLPDAILSRVASQIAQFTPSVASPFADTALQLGETFPVWQVPATAVAQAEVEDPLSSAAPTGFWHHQLFRGNAAVGFARSVPEGPSVQDWRLASVFESELAAQIDAGIAYIDEELRSDGETRLLWLPAYHTHAFWVLLERDSAVIPVAVPRAFTDILRTLTAYSSREFFALLARCPHIIGIEP